MPPLRIFVADDDDVARGVISALLAFRRDWQVCGEASDARTAIQQVELLRPDITLIALPR